MLRRNLASYITSSQSTSAGRHHTGLSQCCSKVPTKDLETFDDLHLAAFNSNSLKMDFEKIICTSANARKRIQRAYCQQQLWIQAPLEDGLEMNAESYGFTKKI